MGKRLIAGVIIIIIGVLPILLGIYAGINANKGRVIEDLLVGVFVWFSFAIILSIVVKVIDTIINKLIKSLRGIKRRWWWN